MCPGLAAVPVVWILDPAYQGSPQLLHVMPAEEYLTAMLATQKALSSWCPGIRVPYTAFHGSHFCHDSVLLPVFLRGKRYST